MGYRPSDVKPLSEPMLVYQMDHWEQISIKFETKHTSIEENVFQSL